MVSEYYPRLKQALRFVEGKGYQPVYVALRGSQNYHLSTGHSDYDYVAVVVPCFDDLVGKSWIQTKEYEYDGGHIDVYDIREYFSCIWKMNPSILETLMTPHHIDTTQEKVFNSCYIYIVEAIPYKAGSLALAIKGTFMQYLKRYGRGLGSGLGKSMSHMVRLVVYMERLYTHQVFDPDLSIGSKSSHAVAMAYKEMSDEAVLASNPQERVDWFTERITKLCDEILRQNQKYTDGSRGEMYRQRINDMVSRLIKEYIKEEMREEDEGNQA